MKSKLLILAAVAGIFFAGAANAQGLDQQFEEMATQQFKKWAQDPVIVAAVRTQNTWSSALTPDVIETMDQKWREEAKQAAGATIDPVMNNPAADFLRARRDEGGGRFAEIFIMDARGLNVAASDVTSDFWQGDEAKWQQTFLLGGGSIFYDSLEYDQSTKVFQTQVSITVDDPKTGDAIGAMTVGVSFASDAVDKLDYGQFLSAECSICHQVQPGTDSISRIGVPEIIDLPVNVFMREMRRQKKSRSFEMRDIAANMGEFELEALAIYLSTVKPE